MGEFELIDRYFKFSKTGNGLSVGVGDDCAIMVPMLGTQWAVSSDMLVEGRHFFSDVDPYSLGQKSLAVNLSDLAACGAKPRGFTLSLALPTVEESWLEGFSKGLGEMSQRFDCPLVGGDTTRGPLCIGITVMGEVPSGQALLRSGAKAGDDLYVSGTLGEARAALLGIQGELSMSLELLEQLRPRLESPTPRVLLGQKLKGLASAAMDLSDGLSGDLAKMMKASGKRAQVQTDWIRDSRAMGAALQSFSFEERFNLVATGGDDYELLFSAPKSLRHAIDALATELQLPLTRVGEVMALETPIDGLSTEKAINSSLVVFLDAKQQAMELKAQSFDHFS